MMERYKVVPLEEVLPLITGFVKPDKRPVLYGAPCHTTGLRLWTFKEKGLKCVKCGIEGSFFAIERAFAKKNERYVPPAGPPYHLNLYALNEAGEEVLMTHDHILARCLGGLDVPENSQTMCRDCNGEKGKGEADKMKAMIAAGETATLPIRYRQNLSRKERDRLAAEKRAKALAESLKQGYLPSGKLCVTRTLDDPEAEKIRLQVVMDRLTGKLPGEVYFNQQDLARLGMTGATFVKRLLETGTFPQAQPRENGQAA